MLGPARSGFVGVLGHLRLLDELSILNRVGVVGFGGGCRSRRRCDLVDDVLRGGCHGLCGNAVVGRLVDIGIFEHRTRHGLVVGIGHERRTHGALRPEDEGIECGVQPGAEADQAADHQFSGQRLDGRVVRCAGEAVVEVGERLGGVESDGLTRPRNLGPILVLDVALAAVVTGDACARLRERVALRRKQGGDSTNIEHFAENVGWVVTRAGAGSGAPGGHGKLGGGDGCHDVAQRHGELGERDQYVGDRLVARGICGIGAEDVGLAVEPPATGVAQVASQTGHAAVGLGECHPFVGGLEVEVALGVRSELNVSLAQCGEKVERRIGKGNKQIRGDIEDVGGVLGRGERSRRGARVRLCAQRAGIVPGTALGGGGQRHIPPRSALAEVRCRDRCRGDDACSDQCGAGCDIGTCCGHDGPFRVAVRVPDRSKRIRIVT